MGNIRKKLAALNADSVRALVNTVNELDIQKEDVLSLIQHDNSYYLLYYRECD